LTEQRGRNKINAQITELKNLLPECKYVTTTKASVLECTVNSLKRLQVLGNQLMQSNKKLQQENRRLRQELQKYSPGVVFEDEEDLSNLSANGTPLSSSSPSGGISELIQVDPVNFNSNLLHDFADQLINNNAEYSSSPPQSSPPSSPISPAYFPFPYIGGSFAQFDADSLSSVSNQTRTYNELDNDANYKVSKRKLLVIFLLLIPFFLSFDIGMPSGSQVLNTPVQSRMLLSVNDMGVDFVGVVRYFDVARTALYLILGLLGLSWTANSFLWFNNLSPQVVS